VSYGAIVTVDAKSAFYQVPAAEVDVWLDNFILMAEGWGHMNGLRDIFRQVAQEARLELHDFEGEEGKPIDVLGVTVHERMLSLPHDWLAKLTRRLQQVRDEPTTVRQTAACIGGVLWAQQTREKSIAGLAHVMNELQRIAMAVVAGSAWDDTWQPGEMFVAEVEKLLPTLGQTFRPPQVGPAVPVFADASDDTIAWVCGEAAGAQHAPPETHIYLKEMAAAVSAALTAARTCRSDVTIYSDNSAVVHALRAAHSSNATANAMIQRLMEYLPSDKTFAVAWVPTWANPADQFSRGTPAPRGGRFAKTEWPTAWHNAIHSTPHSLTLRGLHC
jgi:hypothetical protein